MNKEKQSFCCYTQLALHPRSLVHEMHDHMCVPSELKLEAIGPLSF